MKAPNGPEVERLSKAVSAANSGSWPELRWSSLAEKLRSEARRLV